MGEGLEAMISCHPCPRCSSFVYMIAGYGRMCLDCGF